AQYDVDLHSWPEFEKYIRYVLMSESIQAEPLFQELEDFEQKFLAQLIRTPEEKELIELSQNLTLVEKLLRFGLSPKDWKVYESRASRIRERLPQLEKSAGTNLGELLKYFEAFNHAAIARNAALVDRLIKKIQEAPVSRAPESD